MNLEMEVIKSIAKDIQEGASIQKAYMNNYIRLRRFAINYMIDLNEPFQPPPFLTTEENMSLLVNDISEVFGIPVRLIKKDGRNASRVVLRHLFCYMCYSNDMANLLKIGHFLGYKDHTTVVHGKECFLNGLTTNNLKYLSAWKRYLAEGNPVFTDLFRPNVKNEYSNHSPLGIAK